MTELPLSYLELLCCLGSQAARQALLMAEDVKRARFFLAGGNLIIRGEGT